jgi:hypothetical protein
MRVRSNVEKEEDKKKEAAVFAAAVSLPLNVFKSIFF